MTSNFTTTAHLLDHFTLRLDEELPIGTSKVKVTIELLNENESLYRQPGLAKGIIIMKEDFDSPIEDLKEYVE